MLTGNNIKQHGNSWKNGKVAHVLFKLLPDLFLRNEQKELIKYIYNFVVSRQEVTDEDNYEDYGESEADVSDQGLL